MLPDAWAKNIYTLWLCLGLILDNFIILEHYSDLWRLWNIDTAPQDNVDDHLLIIQKVDDSFDRII
jgi:hypothetical protein